MNTGQVPNHLLATARTGFLSSVRSQRAFWQQVATEIALTGSSAELVDLGMAPMPKRSKGPLTTQDLIEKFKTVTPYDWDITVWISYNAVQDDRTGDLETRVRSAAVNFNRHLDKLVFDAINSGASVSADYGASYDSLSMFNASHVDNGAAYQTAQSNVNTLALDSTNFQTVYVAAATRLDDQGEYTGYVPDLLIVPPALEYTAAQLTQNRQLFGTANNDINPWNGRITHIVVPYLDSTAWYLAATSEVHKPMLVGMRQRPFLQQSWFDPEKPDGGHYYFKFFARYAVTYGDWRLLTQGNT
jgi:phage major head subunit gpT-like protein